MQPIDPPVGGGRVRLLGLYHALASDMWTTYVGTYDWPGPGHRDHHLSQTLREIDVPLSRRHFKVQQRWNEMAGSSTLIDVLFPLMVEMSPDYLQTARRVSSEGDIVVFSHPWTFSGIRDELDLENQLIVYDSQNVEGLLRTELLDRDPLGAEISKFVTVTECDLVSQADLVLACSREDAALFQELYGIPRERICVVPNGTFLNALPPASPEQRRTALKNLGMKGPMILFMGSAYGPNLQAALFISRRLAPSVPEATFAICGGVGEQLLAEAHPPNVRVFGTVDEHQKMMLLRAACGAVNPMFAGSGTNIKMLDFMAAGLPIVSTPVGARGLEGAGEAYLVADGPDLADKIREITLDGALAATLSAQARGLVLSTYGWDRISRNLGSVLKSRLTAKRSHTEAQRNEEQRHRPPSTVLFSPGAIGKHRSRPARPSVIVGTWISSDSEVTTLLLKAVRLLQDPIPKIGLQAVTLTGPSQSGTGCSSYDDLVNQLTNHHTGFISVEAEASAVKTLALCALIVLPFMDPADFDGRALKLSLDSGRPIVALRSCLPRNHADRIYAVESFDPPAIALAIANIVLNPLLSRSLTAT